MQFTWEIEEDWKLPFLDSPVGRDEDTANINWLESDAYRQINGSVIMVYISDALDQDLRLGILSNIGFGVSVWWMRSFYLFWIGLSNYSDAKLSSL